MTAPLADLAGDNDISASTRRWALEMIDLLAEQSPRLDRSLKKIAAKGGVVVLLERTRRRTGDEDRPNYSGKHIAHGLLSLTDEKGNLIWVSSAAPGRPSEITTVRRNKICAQLRNAGLAIADLGFVGVDDDPDNPVIITGRKAARGKPLTASQKEANRLVSRERAANEHGFANLKAWRVLTKVRMKAAYATTLLRALLVLTRLQRIDAVTTEALDADRRSVVGLDRRQYGLKSLFSVVLVGAHWFYPLLTHPLACDKSVSKRERRETEMNAAPATAASAFLRYDRVVMHLRVEHGQMTCTTSQIDGDHPTGRGVTDGPPEASEAELLAHHDHVIAQLCERSWELRSNQHYTA